MRSFCHTLEGTASAVLSSMHSLLLVPRGEIRAAAFAVLLHVLVC